MKYDKPPLSFEDQADLIISRGLVCDRDYLVKILCSVNYYRFSGYLYPFREESSDCFKTGTKLEDVWSHYTFDRQLRVIVMDAIERVEISIKTQLVYHFCHFYKDPFAYLDPKNLPKLSSEDFKKFINRIRSETKRSKESFIKHFKEKYSDYHNDLPLWMATEIMSFGSTLTLFRGIDKAVKWEIAKYFSMPDEVFMSWLTALNAVRNICAHHGRLWNQVLGYKPLLPKERKYREWHHPVKINNEHIFCILTILQYMLRVCAPNSNW
ncbi:MAG: Abi family protein [Planctomycetota bacterium]|jgi:abortive infection bacteriophage resistance protein